MPLHAACASMDLHSSSPFPHSITFLTVLSPLSRSLLQYTLQLQLHGFETDPARVQAVCSAMDELAAYCGASSFQELAEQHADFVMAAVCGDSPRLVLGGNVRWHVQ